MLGQASVKVMMPCDGARRRVVSEKVVLERFHTAQFKTFVLVF